MKIDELKIIGNPFVCSTAVIIRNRSILLGFRNYTPDKWKKISVWTTPGGRCDFGETIEQTLRREVKEEVGISDFEIHEFIGEAPGAKEGDIIQIFFCTTEQDAILMEPEKFSEWRWVPISEYISGGPWSEMNPVAHKIISSYLKKKFPKDES